MLYSKGLQKVLEALHKNKYAELNFREICRLSKLTQPTVLKHLKNLEDSNIIKSKRFKNLKLYSFAKTKLAYNTQASLDIEFIQSLPKIRRDAINDFVKEAEPRIAILFGSTAKKNFTKSSDVDLILVYDKISKYLIEKTRKLTSLIEGRYGIEVNAIDMPLWEFKKELKNKKNYTLQNVKKTGKAIKNGEEYYELITA